VKTSNLESVIKVAVAVCKHGLFQETQNRPVPQILVSFCISGSTF